MNKRIVVCRYLIAVAWLGSLVTSGCSRHYYRRDADAQVAAILAEKDSCEPYALPHGLNVYPDPRARFADPTKTDCPQLPNPEPMLDGYALPPLISGEPEQSQPKVESDDLDMTDQGSVDSGADGRPNTDAGGLRIVPIPESTWREIPAVCLPRMMEFKSIRQEYVRTHEAGVPSDLESSAPRLTLQNVMELALINSRDYQSRKETLYQVALRLTSERYAFELKPLQSGNGTSAQYRTANSGGVQVNSLGVPTNAAVTQTMATAGQFLASFANNVLLTFNGPQGFAADVNSELLFDFQQTIFQRDIVFEGLTQAERDVVYASRDFIRFRRQLFVDLANQYYNLLLSYRAIEIASQDYFSNLRGYLQGQAEYEFRGGLPRVQVDQFEQNALRSRSDLVSRCNQLETQLDRLKLAIGLPPEMDLNLALDELEGLSASDEATVARELVSRAQREVASQQRRGRNDPSALINAASVLMDRVGDIRSLSESMRLAERQDDMSSAELPAPNDTSEFFVARELLSVLEAKARVESLRGELAASGTEEGELLDLQIYRRSAELADALMEYSRRLLAYRLLLPESRQGDRVAQLNQSSDELARLRGELVRIEDEFSELLPDQTLLQLSSYVNRIDQLLEQSQLLADDLAVSVIPSDQVAYRELVDEVVAQSLELAGQSIVSSDAGLDAVELDAEIGMLSALSARLDLSNRRGDLADARRAVKIAADDLRSVLDLRATHILRTPGDKNRPFAFSFDDSETRLSIALDTPLNRRRQRNAYRVALINYNQALRDLIASEDGIKFAIRDDLRQLRLRRNQYEIGVKSAALARERVFSTRLQLQLATGDVVARDFLEAQQAYTSALSSVASQHIAFILDRVQLFFDLEQIRLDQVGYWPGLAEEDRQPAEDLNFQQNNPRPYGRLAPRLKYSEEVRSTVR